MLGCIRQDIASPGFDTRACGQKLAHWHFHGEAICTEKALQAAKVPTVGPLWDARCRVVGGNHTKHTRAIFRGTDGDVRQICMQLKALARPGFIMLHVPLFDFNARPCAWETPPIRLVAMLRDPISRARSQFLRVIKVDTAF